jgi:hypothetical protein
MHYTISKKEIRQAVHVLKACLHHPDADDAIAMLQGLLDQPEGEAVCWLVKTEEDSELGILPYTVICETEHGAGIREMLGAFQVYKKPHSAPITADDVTDEMLKAIKKETPMHGVVTTERVVAIYNAVNAGGAKK